MSKIIVILKGGLGNQMFQYAFAKSLAIKYNLELVLDTSSGFKRDKIYKRRFILNKLNISGYRKATNIENFLYFFELIREKITGINKNLINRRNYGLYINEVIFNPSIELLDYPLEKSNILLNGYWQNEKYFKEFEASIFQEFNIKSSEHTKLKELALRLMDDNSVAIGIRLFEDIPGDDKSGVGGLTELHFYQQAGELLAQENVNYFIFSTRSSLLKDKIVLNGNVEYITCDEGFTDEIETLWLLSHCKKQVIANSSFFWWGAWLAEKSNKNTKIIASRLFPNSDTVPDRWKFEWANLYQD